MTPREVGPGSTGAGPGGAAGGPDGGGDPEDPHRGVEVRSAGASLAEARGALVLLHGRGSGPADLLALAREWSTEGLTLRAPRARNRAWYPRSFMAAIDRNEPHLSSALALVDRLVDELAHAGVPPERQILAGFSQGACLALEYAVRNPRRYGGLVGLSGGLIGPEGATWEVPGALEATPVFLGCSDRDPHIPLERVRETARILEEAGAEVDARIYEGMGHVVNRDEIEAAQGLIDGLGAADGG